MTLSFNEHSQTFAKYMKPFPLRVKYMYVTLYLHIITPEGVLKITVVIEEEAPFYASIQTV